MKRREFLATSGRAALGLGAAANLSWLAACGGNRASTEQSLRTLGRSLSGALVLPSHDTYEQARLPFNPRFDAQRPLGIVYAANSSDVAKAIAWVREHGVPFAPRTGRHSYAGYSTSDGLIIDLGEMNLVHADTSRGTAVVGAGARLIDVYSALAADGLALSAGSCPSVGVSGLVLGGGFGLMSRKHGLTSDNLRQLEIATAGGELLTCSESSNADLFWACRGGGGGNFGIATSFVFDVQAIDRVAYFMITYPWSSAARLLEAFQALAAGAPDELMVIAKVERAGSATGGALPEPRAAVFGQYLGSEAEMRAVIAPLLAPVLGPPTSSTITSGSFLDAALFWAGCSDDSVAQCHLNGNVPGTTPDGLVQRAAYKAKSQFYDASLGSDGIATALAWIEQRSREPLLAGDGALQFDAFGGALNRIAPDATAFVHRSSLMHGQFLAYWNADDPRDVVSANFDWIDGFYAAMRPFASGQAYQNYIDPDLEGWPRAYYGANLERLVVVKQSVDPDGLFRFAQGISPELL